jgi:hypothetical protein
MPRLRPLLAAIVVPLAIGTGWSREARVMLPKPDTRMTARAVALDPDDPARRRLGALRYLGGVELTGRDPAFGGYSALSVRGDRFTLLSDDATILRFTMGRDWIVRDVGLASLPAGPDIGWTKRERDSESMTTDPATGRVWVGFEQYNEIWRYTPGLSRAEGGVAPPAMANWRSNGGIEAMARLADGRFVAFSESVPYRESARVGLVWSGDPVASPAPVIRFHYQAAPGFRPVDLAELPDGRLLLLERRFQLPFRWSNRLVVIDRATLTAGATVRGREIARLQAPLIHDNFEGVAVVREGAAVMLWLVSDDNRLPLQRTLLLKFRLNG